MSLWKKYEQQIIKRLREKYRDFDLKPNQKLKGKISGVNRQVDILLQQENKQGRVIGVADCKFYNKVIDVKKVDCFIGYIRDIQPDFGILVTNKGFSKAAIKRAKGEGINLDIIEFCDWEPFDNSWFEEEGVRAKGEFIIRCLKCNKENVYYGEDLDFEAVEAEERAQGFELFYNALWDDNCEKCGNPLFVSFDMVEYPIGQRSLGNIEIHGGELLRKFALVR